MPDTFQAVVDAIDRHVQACLEFVWVLMREKQMLVLRNLEFAQGGCADNIDETNRDTFCVW